MSPVGIDVGGTFTRVAVDGGVVARFRTAPTTTVVPAALGEDAPLSGAVALLTTPEASILH